MSAQKNKLTIVITLAIVSVLLLGGVSFTFFPTETQPKAVPNFVGSPNQLLPNAFIISSNETTKIASHILWSAINATQHFWTRPETPGHTYTIYQTKTTDTVVIASDGTVNSSAITRSGNTYTFTADAANQTLLIQHSNIVVDGANHALVGFHNGNTYALENMHIENVSDVTVKNLNVSASWQGIWIQTSKNIELTNNNFTDINTAIEVNSANSTRILKNAFANLGYAILFGAYGLPPSIDNTVSDNTINNALTGITMTYTSHDKVTNNTLTNILSSGIETDRGGTITDNRLFNGTSAIAITVTSNSIVTQNTIGGFQTGFQLAGVNSQIIENTVENCSQVALMFGSSDSYPIGGNLVYHNNFFNDSEPLVMYDNASLSLNFWDNTKEGNYWSNYNGTDANKDGVGDTAFQLGDNNTDLGPLMQPYVGIVNSYDHATAQIFFTLAGVIAAGGVFLALAWASFGKRPAKNKPRALNRQLP
jgi:parallel beta-helix repeat protein